MGITPQIINETWTFAIILIVLAVVSTSKSVLVDEKGQEVTHVRSCRN